MIEQVMYALTLRFLQSAPSVVSDHIVLQTPALQAFKEMIVSETGSHF